MSQDAILGKTYVEFRTAVKAFGDEGAKLRLVRVYDGNLIRIWDGQAFVAHDLQRDARRRLLQKAEGLNRPHATVRENGETVAIAP